jgi:two-component system, response regulator / RNA-binding antiterminator
MSSRRSSSSLSARTGLHILLVRDPFASHPGNVDAIRAGLLDAGYARLTVVDADLKLDERIQELNPDMLIIESESAARDIIEGVCVAMQGAPRPIVLFTDNDDTERMRQAIAAGVTAYIVDGLIPERVKPVLDVACARFDFESQLREELNSARNQLAERKTIERAKGLLMKQLDVSEDDAYKKLRRVAMDKNIRLIEAARRILDIAAALS